MSRDKNEYSDNPYRARTRVVRDPHHDAQLLRDVALINADVHARLGALPPGGLPVKPWRKPNLPLPPSVTAASAIYPPEDDPMKLHHLAAAAIMPMAVAVAGCSKGIDAGGVKAQLNAHPQKRYEIIASSQAPGPWDLVKGYIGYDVINANCVPQDSFTGGQAVPNTGLDIEMTRVDKNTWKGYFYRDALQDEDYFGLGLCRWDVTDVSARFTVGGINFSSGSLLKDFLRSGSQAEYFKKSSYGDRNLVGIGPLQFLPGDPEVIKQPDAFFSISVTIDEVAP